MKTLIVTSQVKKVVALSALILAPALALTTSAQAAPKNHLVAMQRADILAEKFPAIYDGPRYGGPIQKVSQVQVQAIRAAHQQIRVTPQTVSHRQVVR